MFIPNKKTILDKIMEDELNDFQGQYKIGDEMEASVEKSVTTADVIYPVDMTKASTNTLLTKDNYCNDLNHPDSRALAYNCEPLYENVISKILTVEGSYTFKEAIPKILPFIEAAGQNFYGALLRDTKNKALILNPFHLLSAISNIKLNSNKKYTIILYFYRNRKEMDRQYGTATSDPKLVASQLDALLHSFGTKVSYKTKVSSMKKEQDGSVTLVTASWQQAHTSAALQAENYIVAHQILARGVIAPFYGASLLTKDPTGSASGTHITPMRSCNISDTHSPDQSGGRTLNRRSDAPRFTSVCTGSQSNATLTGLRSLTHCNLLSPYSKFTIVEGALAYADASINKSLQLFKAAGYIKDYIPIAYVPPKTVPPSPAELEAYANQSFPSYYFENNTDVSLDELDIRFQQIATYIAEQRKINESKNEEQAEESTE